MRSRENMATGIGKGCLKRNFTHRGTQQKGFSIQTSDLLRILRFLKLFLVKKTKLAGFVISAYKKGTQTYNSTTD